MNLSLYHCIISLSASGNFLDFPSYLYSNFCFIVVVVVVVLVNVSRV